MDNKEQENRVQTFVGGKPVGVDARAVERELTNLWAAASQGGDSGLAVIRFCLMNLIAYAPNESKVGIMTETVASLAAYYPSRTIMLLNQQGEGDDTIETSLAAHCRLPVGGGRPICGEQINITAKGPNAAADLPGTVIPLLVSDLPVVLWWPNWPQGALTEDYKIQQYPFGSLLASADELIVDSIAFPKPVKDMARLAQLRERDNPAVAINDLNWIRLTSWRQLTAQIFDALYLRPFLNGLTSVEVRYKRGKDVANPNQALLLVGWLASRMNWQAPAEMETGDGVCSMTISSGDDRPIAVDILNGRGDGVWPGDVIDITLHGEFDGHKGIFSLARKYFGEDNRRDWEGGLPPIAEHISTSIEVDGQNKIERTVHLGARANDELLVEALGNLGHDPLYEAALRIAVGLGNRRARK